MLRRINKKFVYIKKLKRDVLGISLLKRKVFVVKLFLLRKFRLFRLTRKKYDFFRIGWVPRPIYRKRKTKFGKYFLKRQRFRLFYSFIRIRVFKKIVNNCVKKWNGAFFFIYYLESRIDVFLYRINCVSSMRMSRQMILHNKILVNEKYKRSYAYNLKREDILHVELKLFYMFKKILYLKLRTLNLLLNILPIYIEFDLNSLLFMFTQICVFDVHFFFKQMKVYNFYMLMNFYKKMLF